MRVILLHQSLFIVFFHCLLLKSPSPRDLISTKNELSPYMILCVILQITQAKVLAATESLIGKFSLVRDKI